jgi:uncharacterized radical SAM superfamily Fe-S cluster-containing enzyme
MRDWFPLSAMNPFSDVVDRLLDPKAEFGSLKCGCHPNCGIGTVLLVHKKTKEIVPVSAFLDLDTLLSDVQGVADKGLGRGPTLFGIALALLKNYRPEHAPHGYGFPELFRQLLSQTGANTRRIGESEGDAVDFQWRFLFVAGMWFQDLFNYDFRRTEMCIIPYGTQEGEISFCAYNTGVGWRQIIEKMRMTATVAEWFKQHGKHPVYAKHQHLPLPDGPHDVVLRPEKKRHLPIAAE